MSSLAPYALLGSLIAGAAGALVLAVVVITQRLQRRRIGEDLTPADVAEFRRVARLADTVAVTCFAVSAALAIVGAMQHTPARDASAHDHDALVARIARLEGRLGALETRPAAAERRVEPTNHPRPAAPPQEASFGQKVGRGLDTIERHVRRTPDEVRGFFHKVKRFFTS